MRHTTVATRREHIRGYDRASFVRDVRCYSACRVQCFGGASRGYYGCPSLSRRTGTWLVLKYVWLKWYAVQGSIQDLSIICLLKHRQRDRNIWHIKQFTDRVSNPEFLNRKQELRTSEAWISTCFGPTGPSSGEFVQLFTQPLVQFLCRSVRVLCMLWPILVTSHQDRPQHTEHANRAAQKLNQWLREQLYELSWRWWACGPETCRAPAIYE